MVSTTVVIISLDTLRSDCLGVNPNKLFDQDFPLLKPPITDMLDTLTLKGSFFLNCITAAPYTSASHGAYFTGRWPVNNGVYEVFNRRLRSRTLFQMAQAQGYQTTFKSDFPLILGPELGFTDGVDHYLIEDDDGFLDAVSKSGSHVAFAHFGGIHYPYGFHNLRFGGETYQRRLDELEKQYPVQDFEFPDKIDETFRDTRDRELLLRYKRIVQYLYSQKRYTELFSLYLEGIEFFLLNRFTPFLNRLMNILDGRRYLLVVFGDHGEQWDEESYGHHNSMHEGVLRVPFIVLGENVPAGKVFSERIRTVDMLPTVLEWLNFRRPRELDGQSLWPMLHGQSNQLENNRAYAQAYNCEPDAFTRFQDRLLRTGKKTGRLKHFLTKEAVYNNSYKYVRQLHAYEDGVLGILSDANEELFHIGEDLQLVSVNDEKRCVEMAALLDEYNSKLPDYKPILAPEELKRFLQDFGYRL